MGLSFENSRVLERKDQRGKKELPEADLAQRMIAAKEEQRGTGRGGGGGSQT